MGAGPLQDHPFMVVNVETTWGDNTTSFETASISLSPYIRGPKDKRDWTFGFQNQTREIKAWPMRVMAIAIVRFTLE